MTFTGRVIFALGLLCTFASPAFAQDAQRDVQLVAFGALFVFATVVVILTVIWYRKRRRGPDLQ